MQPGRPKQKGKKGLIFLVKRQDRANLEDVLFIEDSDIACKIRKRKRLVKDTAETINLLANLMIGEPG